MKLYEASVRKPITTILLFWGVILFGLYSYKQLAVDLYPEIEPPFVTVFTYYQGANAADVENNVSRILEDNLNTVSNLKKLTSRSQDNVSLLALEFEWGADLDEATNSIRDALSRVERRLPEGCEKPMILKFNTNMIPVLQFSATAKESYAALPEIIEDLIVNPLNRIEGVGAVSISGGSKREVMVEVDPIRLQGYNMTVEQIGRAIAAENRNFPAGRINLGSMTLPLRVQGEFASSDELKNVVVGQYMGRNVLLSDVARVNDSLSDEQLVERRDGQLAVRFSVQKQSGANTVEVAKRVLEELPRLERALPSDVHIDMIVNTSEFIEDSLSSLFETVFFAALFVMLVLLFFLGRWRASFIIILTIPVSLIVAYIYLFASGNSINIISLSALSVAIGMVVDDAIVVLENITSHIERGSQPREAAIYGTNEVALAVVASTLTVVAVFLPLTMMGGLSGIMFRQLGAIVTIVIVVSIVAALTLTPMLASRLLRGSGAQRKQRENALQRLHARMLGGLDHGYGVLLEWVMRHRVLTLLLALGVFVVSLLLAPGIRTEFMPAADNSQIKVTAKLPVGVRVEYTAAVADSMERVLRREMPEIELLATSYGQAGADNVFAAFSGNGTHVINMNLKLVKPNARQRSMFEVSDAVREALQAFPDIEFLSVIPGGGNRGSMGGAPKIDVNIIGHDMDRTTDLAERLAEEMRGIAGTRDVTVSRDPYKREFNIVFDREKLAEHGLNTSTAALFVRNRINGLLATKFREGGSEYDIVVRYARPFRESLEDVRNITLYGATGRPLKLADVAQVQEFYSPPTITRENRQRVVTVSCGMQGVSLGTLVSDIWAAVDKLDVPTDVAVSIGGTAQDEAESRADLSLLLLLVVILVYIVMASQFESFKSPFIIMLSLPFAFSGIIFALLLSGETMNLISMIGSIMLVGIVVKNGIVLVDYTNLLRARGYSVFRAVVEGGKSRLRPVLMTSLTTILGMVPLAVSTGEGAELWRSMGIAVIGGLAFSTLLTLLVVPAMYAIFEVAGMQRKRKRMQRELKQIDEGL